MKHIFHNKKVISFLDKNTANLILCIEKDC